METSSSPAPQVSLMRGIRAWGKMFVNRYTIVISLTAFIVIWELAVKNFQVKEILLPAPSDIGNQFIEIWQKGLLWPPFFDSMKALALGLAISVLVGVPAGIILGSSRIADLISAPYFWALRATPRVAFAPLLVIWVGFGMNAKLWMVFLSAGVLIMLVVQEAVMTVDQTLVKVAKSFGANRRKIYFSVIFPYILPSIANAIRNGIGQGIVGLLVIEMFSASGGLGNQVIRASYTYNSARTFAYIAVLLIVSLGLITISRHVENYVSRWREEAYV